tara:strand:+ start:4611 stop:5150 length:540 start_codon:yes stop_codon:yes gene_type:complete
MADNTQKTQVSNTLGTYKKALDILNARVPGGRILDYGAGLGLGTKWMHSDSFEPNPRSGFTPTYKTSTRIPKQSYDKIVCLNVLNVLERRDRDVAVKTIARSLTDEGYAIITTRGRDVLNAKGELGKEKMSITTTIGTYQKGFTQSELLQYLRVTIGPGYEIAAVRLGPAGAIVNRRKK